MKHHGSRPRVMRVLLAAALLALIPAGAWAQQTGRVTGVVRGPDGQPVAGAELVVVGTAIATTTATDGSFTLDGIPVGAQRIRTTRIGFSDLVTNVIVRAGAETRVDISPQTAPFGLSGVVVSAARQAQRVQDAPATVTRIGAERIEATVGNSFSGALKQVTGLDFIQVGATAAAINARGFNSSFNNRMLMIEDGRIAVLPENGLPVGTFTALPKLDLAAVEVLVGPGAALYGADASNGVITLQSKDPRAYPGMQLEVAGGSRSYFDVQGRYAGVSGALGYKVAAEYQTADDWSNDMTYAISGFPNRVPEVGVGGEVDWTSRVARGSGALYYYLDGSQLELSGGASLSDGVGQTNVGRNQLDGWQYNFQQLEWTHPNWYVNLYRTQSKAGDSYALNRYTEAKARNPDMPDDDARLASDWPSNGQMYAAEIQNNFRIPAFLDSRLVWGAQIRHDVISSDREWLTDRLTGDDLTIDQKGVYGQLEVPVHPMLDLVAAARYDDHEAYEAQFSPKAAAVFKPDENHSFRLSFNRAFKSPTTLQTDFYIPDFTAVVAVMGNRHGFTARDANGAVVATYEGLVPEENQTWELGYKGAIARKLLLDAAFYRADYTDFLSPLVIIANPYAAPPLVPTFAYDADGNRIVNDFGPPITLTYLNLGEATLQGVDLGANYLLTPTLSLSGTFSWTDLKDVEAPETAAGAEATSLNAPDIKWTLGASATELLPNLGGGVYFRHVTGYTFRSGINFGKIPTFDTIDLEASYRLPLRGTSINLNVSNLFTCRTEYEGDERTGRGCGFGEKHLEMINMPEIGSMVFLGVRVTR